jgi:tetrapyrrole methylase family protein / MazG family protein
MIKQTNFIELKRVFGVLNGPDGCPWDKKQTQASLLAHLNEEVGEYVAAVRKKDIPNIREELGDILLHVMFSAQIAQRTGDFTIEDVIAELIAKLKRRHPHVFGSVKATSARQVIANWRRIKADEKKQTGVYQKKG